MIWGAISNEGPLAIVRCDGKILNSENYTNLIESNLINNEKFNKKYHLF